jgi:hypothetical protein
MSVLLESMSTEAIDELVERAFRDGDTDRDGRCVCVGGGKARSPQPKHTYLHVHKNPPTDPPTDPRTHAHTHTHTHIHSCGAGCRLQSSRRGR